MIDREERIILEALRRELATELGLYRQLLDCATRKRDSLVANNLVDLHTIVEEENGVTARCAEQRRLRDDLVRRLVNHRRLEGTVSLTVLLEGVGEPLLGAITQVRDELHSVVSALSQLNDNNQLMLRTSLSLVRELLSTATGVEERQGYDRSGLQGERRGSGGLMNYSA